MTGWKDIGISTRPAPRIWRSRPIFALLLMIAGCIICPEWASAGNAQLSTKDQQVAHHARQETKRPTEEQKLWALGMSAFLERMNDDRLDRLGGSFSEIGAATTLHDSWGVDSRKDLLNTLAWLESQGHRSEFDAIASETPAQLAAGAASGDNELVYRIGIVRQYKDQVGPKSIAAWDYGRFVMVCGWGYKAGYISESEAWARIMPIARRTQATFSSWPDFGSDYVIGRRFWSEESTSGDEGKEMMAIYEDLVSQWWSPWTHSPWNLDLGGTPDRKGLRKHDAPEVP